MKKLNSIGEKLLDYKNEYDKSSSQVIKDALLTSLDVMVQQKLITPEIKSIVISGKNNSELVKVLELDARFKKSPRELYREYEKIREAFDECLKSVNIQGFFETETSIEFNRISVLRQYSVDKTFILDYFGIQEIDLIQLMKKRGFAEKFAVLRMNLIFDEILEEIKIEENIMQSHSLVYYNPDITGFSIDYKYHINVDLLEDPAFRVNLAKKIAEVDRSIDNKYKTKMGLRYYQQKRAKKENPQPQVKLEKQDEEKVVIPEKNNINIEKTEIKEEPQTQNKNKSNKNKNQSKKNTSKVDDGFQELNFDKKEDNKKEEKTETVNFSFDDI